MAQLVITAVGTDRPGLVGELSRHLHEQGANLADSRMINLRGQFALLALVEGSADALAATQRALQAGAQGLGLRVDFAPFATAVPPTRGIPYRLKSYSADQPGIVHRVTDLLRRRGVNIEELETRLDSAPFAGTPLFTLEAVLTVPSQLPIRQLRGELDALGAELACDIDVDPA